VLNVGFGERLKDAFEYAPIGDIAQQLKLTYHAVRNYTQGRVPAPEVLIQIHDLTGCSIHWLLTGQGPKRIAGSVHPIKKDTLEVYLGEAEREIVSGLANEAETSIEEELRDLILESLIARGLIRDSLEGANLIFFGEHLPKLVPVKLLGEIAAGQPLEVYSYEETVMVAEEFIVEGRRPFVLKVRGDSMTDEGIFDGDLIICYESPEAYNGQTVVALVDGDKATVKKFYKEQGRIRLQPGNPQHKPIILTPDRVRIQGIVVGIQRRP